MSKLITLLMLILSLTLNGYASAARPDPLFNQNKNQGVKLEGKEDICEGASNEEDCLIRRTLAAHVDYIYTQKNNHKSRP